MKKHIAQLLKVDAIRILVGRLRLFYYLRIKRNLKTINSEQSFEVTIMHNLKTLKVFGMNRMERIISPIAAIESLKPESKILVIGPRNEGDIIRLWGHGFFNVTGLDLITYSPHIKIGDMHEMPFEDNIFDVVICGWTLAYSKTPQKLADEMTRVSKSGAIIGIGQEYSSLTHEESIELLGYNIVDEGTIRLNTVDDLKKLFKKIKTTIFSHDAPDKRSHNLKDGLINNPSSVIAVFQIDK